MALGLLLTLAAIAWERGSAALFALYVPALTRDLAAFVSDVLLNPAYRGLTLTWFFVGGLLAMLVFAISTVSIPMLIDRPVDIVTAMRTSLRAVTTIPARCCCGGCWWRP